MTWHRRLQPATHGPPTPLKSIRMKTDKDRRSNAALLLVDPHASPLFL